MTTTFSLNRDKVILGALKKVGAISQGETPNSNQISDASDTLNSLVKAWQADGLPLWKIKKVSFPLTQGKSEYNTSTDWSLASKPLKIMQVLNHDTLTNADIQLINVSRQEYNLLGMKVNQGTPTQYYYDPQKLYGIMTLYPVPDAYTATNRQLQIIYQDQFDDILSATDIPDFPTEWVRALVYGLASDLSDEYGMPIRERTFLAQKAQLLKSEVLSFGQEDSSLYMSINTNGQEYIR